MEVTKQSAVDRLVGRPDVWENPLVPGTWCCGLRDGSIDDDSWVGNTPERAVERWQEADPERRAGVTPNDFLQTRPAADAGESGAVSGASD